MPSYFVPSSINPLFSLARGDAFKNNFFAYLLYQLKLLPVYRVSEGVENLKKTIKPLNFVKKSFDKRHCFDI
jgi:hypothetical protein